MQQPGFFEWLWNEEPALLVVVILGFLGNVGVINAIVNRSRRRLYAARLFVLGLLCGTVAGVIQWFVSGDAVTLPFMAGAVAYSSAGTGTILDVGAETLDRFAPACRIRLSR